MSYSVADVLFCRVGDKGPSTVLAPRIGKKRAREEESIPRLLDYERASLPLGH